MLYISLTQKDNETKQAQTLIRSTKRNPRQPTSQRNKVLLHSPFTATCAFLHLPFSTPFTAQILKRMINLI